ncbi:hypothetical protein PHMEG_00020046 [Phytophthora megakarya]|uniref:Uncharacterized protein n=1 Tax=Phytophthora megakarya TaxID=4795 RepID=A0A225VRL4_9STRA|nr:hypothetical protein PHMEG_00020046 [Phytophthora megakarya]
MSITIPNHQLEFLLESMSPNIVFNTRIGLGSVVNYWKWVSHSFSDFEMELKSLEKDVEGCLAAQTTVNLTITKSTIQKLFPQLWRGENLNASGAPTSSVVRSLLGKPIVMHNWIRFEWDPTYHQITSITSTSDLLMPIIKLLGDLDSVSFLFDKAFVSPDFDGR